MKKFYSIEEVWAYYFPKETAEKRDRELRENDPDEWLHQQVQKIFEKVKI
jgi:hypothetical protein